MSDRHAPSARDLDGAFMSGGGIVAAQRALLACRLRSLVGSRRMPPRLVEPVAPVDGRQSETALFVARGARRHLRSLGFATVTEMPLRSGRRADLVALGADGTLLIVEIKSSVADFRADAKWRDYRAYCDRLFFAIPDFVPAAIMPEDAGLLVADAYGAALVRPAPEQRLAPATRRAVTHAFARLAANRLHALVDPAAVGRDGC